MGETREASGEPTRAIGTADPTMELFAVLVANAHEILTVLESDGTIRFSSPSVTRVLGYERSEIEGHNALEFMHPDDRERVGLQLAEEAAKPGFGRLITCRSRTKSGEYRVLESIGNYLLDDPRVNGIVATSRDITEQHEAQHRLTEQEQQYKAVLDAIDESVYVFDLDHKLKSYNLSAAMTVGLTEEHIDALKKGEPTGIEPKTFFADGTPITEENQPQRIVCETGEPIHGVVIQVRDASTKLDGWRRANYLPLRGADGQEMVGYVVSATNITAEYEAHQAAIAARDEALQASAAKSEFLATVSHEIRTPLNGVIGALDLLHNSDLPEPTRPLVEMVDDSAHTLKKVLDDVLDLSKIEADRLVLEEITFDLHQAVEAAVELFVLAARNKQISLLLEISKDTPRWVCGDRDRLRQVLVNLLSNAVKFTERGEVQMRVTGPPRGSATAAVTFTVKDSGIGIPAERRDTLFEPFVQVDGSMTRRFGGTGLGLAISQRLVTMMGGDIAVESNLDSGSEFSFTVPLPATTESKVLDQTDWTPVGEHSQLNNTRILVCEDNPTNQAIVTQQLEYLGVVVDTASNGLEALEQLARGSFDAVLMDCQMPELDGIEATRRLRADGVPEHATLPVIALTANTVEEVREECLASGMNGVLSKPITMEELAVSLEHWVGTDPQTSGGASTPAATETNNKAKSKPSLSGSGPIDKKVLAVLIEELGDDYEVVRTVIDTFLGDLPNRRMAFDAAVRDVNADDLSRAAHSVKSSAATLGAVELARLCQMIEAEPSAALVANQELISSFDQECDRVATALASIELHTL